MRGVSTNGSPESHVEFKVRWFPHLSLFFAFLIELIYTVSCMSIDFKEQKNI